MNRKLLLVEDNLSDIELVRISLREMATSIDMSCFRDGIELMQYLQTGPTNEIGVILMDLNMPRMNGHEVLQMLRTDQFLCTLPVVIFSTSANEQDISKSYELGARAYVCKPIDYLDFSRTINQIVTSWIGNPTLAA